MGLARIAVEALDRRGARWLLSRIATLRTGVRVEYDGERWLRILPDGLVIADLARFGYYMDTLANSEREVALVEASARDSWFYNYRPSRADVIVDVGAGSGIETRVFSSAVPQGHVYAIEAHPETYARLQTAVWRNGWTNVTPVFGAVTDTAGTVYIQDRAKDVANAIGDAGLPVPGRTLDHICAEYGIGQIDFLKMNIEGAERLAIAGMTQAIEKVRSVCIACHDFRAARERSDFFRTRQLVIEFLRDHGFETTTRPDHPRRFARDHVYGRRP